jgi:hypothetical protein
VRATIPASVATPTNGNAISLIWGLLPPTDILKSTPENRRDSRAIVSTTIPVWGSVVPILSSPTAGSARNTISPTLGRGQSYPIRPVRIVVGFGAGGASDIFHAHWAVAFGEATPFKCDSLDPKVCFDIYRRRMEQRPEGFLHKEYSLGKVLADWPIDPLKDWNTAADVRGKSRGLIDPPKGSNPEVWLKNWVTIPKDSPIRP